MLRSTGLLNLCTKAQGDSGCRTQDTLMRRGIPECAPLAILEDVLGQIQGSGNRHHLLSLCTCKHDAQHASNHAPVGIRQPLLGRVLNLAIPYLQR